MEKEKIVKMYKKQNHKIKLLYLPEYPFYLRLAEINKGQRPWDLYTYVIQVAAQYGINADTISIESKILLKMPISYKIRGFLQAVKALFVLYRYDVVLAWRGPCVPILIARFFFRWRKPKIIFIAWRPFDTEYSGLKYHFKKILAKITASVTDQIIVVSSLQVKQFSDILGVQEEKISFLPYGVDCKFFKPLKNKAWKEPFFVTVGNVYRDDGLLLDVIKDMPVRMVRVTRFASVDKNVKKEAMRKKLKNISVRLDISYAELADLLRESYFVVLPLIPTDQPVGLTALMEAMAVGKTVIVTKGLESADYVFEGKTGILVKAGDELQLKKNILKLLRNPEKRERIGLAARRAMEEKFSLEIVSCKLVNLIQEVVK